MLLLLQLALLAVAIVFYVNLRRTADRQSREVGELRAENLRLRQDVMRAAERQKRAEQDRSLAASQKASEPGETEPQIESEPNGLLERVIRLKSYFAQHPERAIPEMRLVTDEEWMEQAKVADLETELGHRKALFMLLQSAFNKSGRIVTEALKAYMAAHAGALPADTSQLVPYLSRPEDAAYITHFRRNDESHSPFAPNPNAPPTVWVFKASPQVDPWFPYNYYVGQNGEQGMASPKAPLPYVEAAAAKYRKASGKPPTEAAQLIPYLEAPVATSVLDDIFNAMKKPVP